MSYEEIDKDAYGTDVFTNGAEGRYSKPKLLASNGTTENKRATKAPTLTTDEQPYENEHSDGVVKTKKKIRKVEGNVETQNEYETIEIDSAVDGETAVKTKKKRAPKAQATNENFDPTPATAEEESVKKKKRKAPKVPTAAEDSQLVDGEATINDLDQTATTKVKKTKKPKAPKATTESYDDVWMGNKNEYTTNSGIYLNVINKLYLRVFFHTLLTFPTNSPS
ncbi:unnamed protein product [Rotaria magnacalcarata]|uniref:Uncharacterized protein n=1 Tax=Rotaria magnacalcarata TaxID=392030 RepID=A0A814N966_9BILA|nr:unnamed protein product [Rotaria magnacalcarata]